MAVWIYASWVSQVLRLLPSAVHSALDRWSHRMALRRAAARRDLATQAAAPKGIAYKLKPWRD